MPDDQPPTIQFVQVPANDAWSKGIAWLTSQKDPQTVILFLLLLFGMGLTYWHLTIGVPSSEKRRHDFFTDLTQSTNAARKEDVKSFIESNEKVAKTLSESLDKVEASFDKQIDRALRTQAASSSKD